MHLQIVGGGSVGLLLAGRLGLGPGKVELICRSNEQAEAVSLNGIKMTGLNGEVQTVYLESVLSFEMEIRVTDPVGSQEPDWILLTLKQNALDNRFIQWLAGRMGENTRIVCFQNGIGHLEPLAEAIPKERLYTAVNTEGAGRSSSWEVSQTGRGVVWIGSAFGNHSREAKEGSPFGTEVQPMLQALRQAGIDARFDPFIENKVWNKLVINSVINPLTAITGFRNGELILRPELQRLGKLLFQEAQALASNLDIPIAEDLWQQVMDVCERTSANHSSMLQDIQAGRNTEIDWINGSLLRLAERAGMNCPTQEIVYWLVKSLEPKPHGSTQQEL